MKKEDFIPGDCFLRPRAVALKLGIALSTFWKLVHEGKFPLPDRKMGKRCTQWLASTVDREMSKAVSESRKSANAEAKKAV